MPEIPGLVARVIVKARYADTGEVLSPDECPLSANKVTGHSLNFPIRGTCAPTKVCASTCYFAKGATTWPTSIAKQLRLYNSTVADPIGTGDRIIRAYDRLGLTFLRWNGGGDLFDESVKMLNHVQAARPDLVNWVVTRRPEMVALVDDAPNTYLHFSLDRSSLARRHVVEALGRPRNLFFSYQAAPGETPDPESIEDVAVLFYDGYRPPGDTLPAATCPLNVLADIAGACGSCRRCFDGSSLAPGAGIA